MPLDSLFASIRATALIEKTPIVTEKNALFLSQMVRANNPSIIVEVGWAVAYSTLVLASALLDPNGKVISFEKSMTRYAQWVENIAASGLGNRISFSCGDVAQLSDRIPAAIDFAFVDGMKRETKSYIDLLYPRLRNGGVMIVDDVIKFEEKMDGFREHLDTLGIRYSLLPIDEDDGVILIVKE